ncbi:dihydropteridine reductase [Cotesia typhae]|uniref:dihydropteridine reductase n=1 Tax=Cotesia typhae TaxID=2053667 RepID=UPI003D6974AF
MASNVLGRVFIYGGKGALGSVCVSQFKAKKWWVGNIDMKENESADVNIVVNSSHTWKEQESTIISQMKEILKDEKLDGIICVAGGWAGGNAAHKDFLENSELMWKQSVWSSTIASSIAVHYLKEGGFLSLTGAKAALEGTPGMIGYGMAKAAVHQLTKSLADENSGLPKEAMVVSILPVTLDTPMNRKWMSKADTTSWTPLEFVAEMFWKWANKIDRPKSGSLLQLITKDDKTEIIPA